MKSIKSLLLFLVFLGPYLSNTYAQQADSTSFEDQRRRVNNLLDERSKKFGDFDKSLEEKTGIFGLFKSKNDMQKSIDILKSIVINDNNIFIETRRLLDLKDSEKERFQQLATEYDQQITAYLKTISQLQKENDKLRDDIKNLEDQDHSNNNIFYIGTLIFLILIYIIFRLYRKIPTKNVTQV